MFLVCTGGIQEKAVVENHELVIRPILGVVCTVDHRFGDAALFLKFLKIMKAYVEDPEGFNADDFPDSIPYHELDTRKKN